jgi:mRNA interferase MazF
VICEFGDVVVVPFPFVDQPVAKRRPAVVLSGAAFNGDSGQSVLAMITSAGGSSWPSDLAIEDQQHAGLTRRCVIRWKLFTLPNHLIVQRIGELSDADEARLSSSARHVLPWNKQKQA